LVFLAAVTKPAGRYSWPGLLVAPPDDGR